MVGICTYLAVVDPAFPRTEPATLTLRAPNYFLAFFPDKCMKMKEIGVGPTRGVSPVAPFRIVQCLAIHYYLLQKGLHDLLHDIHAKKFNLAPAVGYISQVVLSI